MPMYDIRPDGVGLKRKGKIRLGYVMRDCPFCKKATKAKLENCEHCGKKLVPANRNDTRPESAPHFVVEELPEVVKVYGLKPTTLNIIFAFDTIDENAPAAHKLYNATSLACLGDGRQIVHAINPQTGRKIVRDGVALVDFEETLPNGQGKRQFRQGEFVSCPGKEHSFYAKCRFCSPRTTLKFFIEEIPSLSTFDLDTGSEANYRRIMKQLGYFAYPQSQGGMGMSLKGVPFRLHLAPEQMSYTKRDKKGNPIGRARTTKYLISLEIDPTYMARLNAVQRQLAAPERVFGLLTAPDESYQAADTTVDPDDNIIFDGDVIELPASEVPPPDEKSEPEAREAIEPSELKGHLLKKVEKLKGDPRFFDKETSDPLPAKMHPLGENTPKLTSALFQAAFGVSEFLPAPKSDMYHTTLHWLWSVDSANELTAAQVDVMLDWWYNGQRSEFEALAWKNKFKMLPLEPVPTELSMIYTQAVALMASPPKSGEFDDMFPPKEEAEQLPEIKN